MTAVIVPYRVSWPLPFPDWPLSRTTSWLFPRGSRCMPKSSQSMAALLPPTFRKTL